MPAASSPARMLHHESARTRAPRSAYLSWLVSLIGLGIAIYMTYEHYTGNKTLACSESSTVNCVKVTTSEWSMIGPIPVAVFGLAYFVGMAVLCSPLAWRRRLLDVLRVVGAAVGVVSAIYLVWVELFRVDAICLWCTGVHVCTVLLLVAVLWTTSSVSVRGGPVRGG